MTPEHLNQVADYMDGTLSAEERRGFEAALASDPALAAEVQLQKKIDASLGRLFADDETSAPAPLPIQQPGVIRKLRWFGLAAAILLVGAAAWIYLAPTDPLLLPPETVYANMKAINFVPTWKCKDDRQFIDTVKARLGEGLLVHDDNGVQVVGWAYGSNYSGYPISKDSMILITQYGSDHMLVFVDRAQADRHLKLAKDSGLHIFRKTVGGLVLYEVSPRTEPTVLPLAKSAE